MRIELEGAPLSSKANPNIGSTEEQQASLLETLLFQKQSTHRSFVLLLKGACTTAAEEVLLAV